MLQWVKRKTGESIARYLEQPSRDYRPFSVSDPQTLRRILEPGDVLLIEGNQRVSVAVKYLTQSTWSHAALYIGNALDDPRDVAEPRTLVEADLVQGVIAVPLSKYEAYNTRICRAVGLTAEDRNGVVQFVIDRLGLKYDLKNVVDLVRYLLPQPPVPTRWRRRMLALGSGDPTRAICSTLIAQAFQAVPYPILPRIRKQRIRSYPAGTYTEREILHIRHYSLFAPRDFDLSPYFRVVKPALEQDFDYKRLIWDEDILS
jgi:hypothetical protein